MNPLDKKEEYMEQLTDQIRCRKAKEMAAEEISRHIEDQKDYYRKEGDDEITAAKKALEQMGDPVEVGKQLDKVHRPRFEWRLFLAALFLCLAGVFARFSMDTSVENMISGPVIIRQLIFISTGLLLMAGVYFLDYTILGRYPKLMWFLLIAAILGYAPFGKWINNQIAYIYVYSMLFIPLYGGILYAYRNKGYTGILKCLLFGLMAVAVESLFIDNSAVYLGLLLSCLIMLLTAVSKNWFAASKIKAALMVIGWVPAAGLIILMDSGGYRLVRLFETLQILWKPDQYEKGFQMSLIRGILSGAKLFGSASEVSFQNLSGYNNDFILTYIFYRWGIVPGIFMIALFAGFIGRMIYISLTRKNSLGMLVGLGCSLVFAVQSVVYILYNLGFRIIAQVSFPFVSFGGAGIFTNFIVLGLMMSVFRNTNLIKEVPYKEKIVIRIERVK